ncbi:MAG: SIMPL domain-containing protein [Candidatus Magasanikbacteria bacterium]|nr:SIMPL domain-containing protein [Candidatus Magasanikbacteria bacterium]
MPVKSNSGVAKECCGGKHSGLDCFPKKILVTLLGILLVYIIILVGTIIRNNLAKYDAIGQADKMEHMITVEADGKVTAKPDIAVTTMGMKVKAKTVLEAQQKNTEVMNKLIAKLKDLGIAGDDIKTVNYNVYPEYDYKDGSSILIGYSVSQSVTIKIRDLSKADKALALAGELGLGEVGGLSFTIDDNEVYLAQARQKALEKVAEKARVLSQMLGVRVTGVVSYSEYEADGKGVYYKAMDEYGMGGAAAPAIEAGSMDVEMRVSVTLGIK